ncbi:MAG: hypothetical protein H6727_16195 [Myxococcales bacterium]|nr:hypothetical protein [Myxococcales bacterium]
MRKKQGVGIEYLGPFKRLFAACLLLAVALLLHVQVGCVAERLTDRLSVVEGPSLNFGRMSASLGAVVLADKRVVVVGGSATEYPFRPLVGKQAIEILRADWSKWELADIDVPYPLAGLAYVLRDGRILAFSSGFQFDAASNDPEGKPIDGDVDFTSAPVSAVLIDVDKKTVIPYYRPKNNDPSQPPIKGDAPPLMQRAFERSLQLKDGRILRIGAYMRYQKPAPEKRCIEGFCRYCYGEECTPFDATSNYACNEASVASDCPQKWGDRKTVVSDVIEVFTPPSPVHPLGEIKVLRMNEGRSSTSAIELADGRVFITGGWGPDGEGSNQAYSSTYFLDPQTLELTDGPRMIIPREDHAMQLLNDGRVLITGGTNKDERTVNTTEIFDPKTNQYVNGPSMTLSREDHVPIALGPWVIFVGGEVNDRADQIRNSAEAFSMDSGEHISAFLLFSRQAIGDKQDGYAGITDGAVLTLDTNRVIIFGGQQGLQDITGEYTSAGFGSTRSLIVTFNGP